MTLPRYANPYHRGLRCDAWDRGRGCGAGAALCGSVLGRHGRLDPAWPAPAVATLSPLGALALAHTGRSSLVHAGLPHAASHAPAAWACVRHAPVHRHARDAWRTPGAAAPLAPRGGCALPQCRDLPPRPWGGVPACARGVGTVGRRSSCPSRPHPPLCHDGTARPIPRPHDPTEPNTCSSGKTTRPRRQNLLRIHATLRLVCLRATQPGSVHDKRRAATTPSPLPAGRQRLQDVGVQGGTREGVDILPPTKKPRRRARTPEQQADTREMARRRVRIAQVHSRVKRCRMRKETIRMWQDGIRDRVMGIGCARHNF